MVFFENTASVPVDMSGNKKVFISIDQSKIDDGSANAENGTGIGAITTHATTYPPSNFVALYSVASGTPTDARVGVKSKLMRSNLTAWRILVINGNGDETEIAFGADGTVMQSNGATALPTFVVPTVNITALTEITSVPDNIEMVGFVP